jgi:hypothetical protein
MDRVAIALFLSDLLLIEQDHPQGLTLALEPSEAQSQISTSPSKGNNESPRM